MSAIFGLVNSSNHINSELINLEHFENYNFDHISHYDNNNIFFSCYHQIITKESENEVLPYYDDTLNCVITADVILDNREELFNLLDCKMSSDIADSALILMLYSKYKYNLLKYIIGDFAFAIFDYSNDELFIARDHVGKRTLYYKKDTEAFSFSTILSPLTEKKTKFNQKYLKSFMAVKMLIDNYHESETIQDDVLLLLPGHYGIYKAGLFTEIEYWSLKNSKKAINNKSYDDFKKIYNEAVRCRLRTYGNVGLSLSGGLDSSSVACIAAEILSKENKELISYTSVPSDKYPVMYPSNWLIDETYFVNKIKEQYDNIKLNFDCFDGYDSLNVMENLISILEQPYKFIGNEFWTTGVMERAQKDSCKVLLDGQFGNLSVSFSNIHNHQFELLKTLKFKKYITDLSNYCRINKISRKKFLKNNVKSIFTFGNKKNHNFFYENYNLSSSEYKNLNNYMNKLMKLKDPKRSHKKSYRQNLRAESLNHLAAAETKLGLKYHLIHRDPTRDVRVLEFCYHAPISMFNKDGDYRTLIKEAYKGVIPDEVLYNRKRGLQGWDWLFRIETHWSSIINELNSCNSKSELYKYINYESTKMLINNNQNIDLKYNPKNYSSYKLIVFAYCCKKYLDSQS